MRMLHRDMRMTDASLLANQQRVVGFFASTTLLLMAAVLTALTTSEQIAELTSHIPLTHRQAPGQIETKLSLLLLIFIYAFFKVTWSLRQYGFTCGVRIANFTIQATVYVNLCFTFTALKYRHA